MKKRITLLLIGCIILSCLCIPISAANSESSELYHWTNITYIDGTISFDGTSGNYSMVISGVSGVSKITATATLYYKNSRGKWMEIPQGWTYSVNDDELIINEDFVGVSGREYKVELSATVYKGGNMESVNRTSMKTCP